MQEKGKTKGSMQDRTPLLDAMAQFREKNPAYFCIPGHRFARGADERALEILGQKAYDHDLTEAPGMDDLHQPAGVIREAEELAAEFFGARRTWFLVNGTTCANEAMILSCVRPGEKILVARNAHKSVLLGLILSGAMPAWLEPSYLEDYGISGAVDPEEVRKKLEADPDLKACFLVSPTYYGVCSPVAEIAEICHAHGIPLLVDEAHGAHMYANPAFPEGALVAGADLVSQSMHKTGASFTQSSFLHLQGNLVKETTVSSCLHLVMSTSPSYLLMGSLDGARHRMAVQGKEDADKALDFALLAESLLLKIPGVRILSSGSVDANGAGFTKDPLRLVFSAADAGIDGYTLQEALFCEYGVCTELSDPYNVVAVITWGNTEEEIRKLCRGTGEIVQKRRDKKLILPKRKLFVPEVICSPRDAFYAQKERLPLLQCIGRTAAESIIPYPPGIPVLCPGERISEEVLASVMEALQNNVPVHGPEDKTLHTLSVLKSRG